jgi:hypothetical protein
LDLATYLRKEHTIIQEGYTPVIVWTSPADTAFFSSMLVICTIAMVMVFVCAYGGIFVALWLNRKKTMSSKRIFTKAKELM